MTKLSELPGGDDPPAMKLSQIKDGPDKPMSAGDVASGAASNLIPSTVNVVKQAVGGVAGLFTGQTEKGLYETSKGELEKLEGGIQSTLHIPSLNLGQKLDRHEVEYADALNEYLENRYGSTEGIKKAVATDPAGVLADLSTVMGGGGSMLARMPGVLGKIGEFSRTAGRITNPIEHVSKLAKAVGHVGGHMASETIGSLATRTGGQSLRLAAEAGRKGGKYATEFLANLRGNAEPETVVKSAKSALREMRDQRNKAYQASKAKLAQDKTVLDFNDIDAHLQNVQQVSKFKGEEISEETGALRQKIADIVDHWRKLSPADFHTPEGMDALKQKIGNIKTEPNTPDSILVDNARRAVRETITKQAPGYASMMKEYEEASDLIREMESTFSLRGPKPKIDTALRKLQSIFRGGVTANFGYRAKLADELGQHAPFLETQIAGQTLSSLFPTGIGHLAPLGVGAITAVHHPYLAIALAPLAMPRVAGEAAYYTGKVSGALGKVAPPSSSSVLLGARAAGMPSALEGGDAQPLQP